MYIRRAATTRLRRLAANFPAVVVSGARQVGKSTLLTHEFGANARHIVFDPLEDIAGAREDPGLFLQVHPAPLILDEIQYVPELVSTLKRHIDRHRDLPGQFLITGSQQWGVIQVMAESLAGRAVFIDLENFSLLETADQQGSPWLHAWLEQKRDGLARIGMSRTLPEQLWRGFFPEVQRLGDDLVADYFTGYLRTYLERDVRALSDVGDLAAFSRFVRLAAALTAQEINYSHLGRELGMAPQTGKRWLDMLQVSFQWMTIPPYSGNTIKRISGKPKGYFADTGFLCMLQSITTPDALFAHPLWGAVFETAVVAELRKALSLLSPKPELYHWRTSGGAEVDIIVERDGVFFPIEIKAKSNPSKRDTRGLQAFRDTYPHLKMAPGLVVAPSPEFRRISADDYVMPWDACLPTLTNAD